MRCLMFFFILFPCERRRPWGGERAARTRSSVHLAQILLYSAGPPLPNWVTARTPNIGPWLPCGAMFRLLIEGAMVSWRRREFGGWQCNYAGRGNFSKRRPWVL